jgi:hypothetical protein
LRRATLANSERAWTERAVLPARARCRSKYPVAAFAAVEAPGKPFHSPDLGTPCCETKARALSCSALDCFQGSRVSMG